MLSAVLDRLLAREDLTAEQMQQAVQLIMDGQCEPIQVAAMLTALRMKGETVDEVVGAVRAMRDRVLRIRTNAEPLLDVVGTGGDNSGTFNISTAAAIVAAAAGANVAKHGNRNVSSNSGSADVLEALGVRVDVEREVVEACLAQIGLGFCFAPLLHPAMRHAMPVRRDLGFRTVFNILGPLTNPAFADRQLLGAGTPEIADLLARALADLGAVRAFVVHSQDGLDEISLSAPTDVWEVHQGRTTHITWTAEDFGLSPCALSDIRVSGPEPSAQVIRGVLGGRPGPARDTVLANTAAALLACDLVNSVTEGVAMASEAIDSGRAGDVLARLIEYTQRPASAGDSPAAGQADR